MLAGSGPSALPPGGVVESGRGVLPTLRPQSTLVYVRGWIDLRSSGGISLLYSGVVAVGQRTRGGWEWEGVPIAVHEGGEHLFLIFNFGVHKCVGVIKMDNCQSFA